MSRKIKITDQTKVTRIRSEEELAAESESAAAPQPGRGRAERIISMPVTSIFPDPDQPRMPLLPFGESGGFIRERFIAAQIDCFQAAKEWIEVARQDVGHSRRLRFLSDMAAGFTAEDGGQINPVTVVPMQEPRDAYLIETGEQRYWATVLGYVSAGMNGPVPQLKVVVKQDFSRKRQVLENRHVGPPTVVTQAREIAALFISEGHLSLPEELAKVHPAERDPLEVTRWVAEQRKPHKSWQTIEEIMSMSMRNMSKILNIARLPTDLLAVADRYELSMRTLLEIQAQPAYLWEELVDRAVNEGWPSGEQPAAELDYETIQPKPKKKTRPAHRKAFSRLIGFVRALNSNEDPNRLIAQVADDVAVQKETDAIASYQYLDALTAQLRLRLLDKGLIDE
ncbi:MAG: hypothetical protein JW757_09925 [Anaerolineales bacterium]|nr:hypothetical protein [Anaerolineales bacterium]